MTWVIEHADCVPPLQSPDLTRLRWVGSSTAGPEFVHPPERSVTEWLFGSGSSLELTFTPPRSVLRAAFGGRLPDRLDAVLTAHEHAVEETLATWERHATAVRFDTCAGVEWCPAVGLAGLSEIEISPERQMICTRVHVSTLALTLDDDQWRALVVERFLDWQTHAWSQYQRLLAMGVRRSLGWGFEFPSLTQQNRVVADAG
ncbi:relaxase domain-containing protein [Rhodococcus sp. NPDC058514]|uniref:relaxase domain-containing protein n=1 Tax=unclassified Rhodococcus (in: high G+C Gram-positive bacteria) TaxID=192944 RepID=UPI00364A44E4